MSNLVFFLFLCSVTVLCQPTQKIENKYHRAYFAINFTSPLLRKDCLHIAREVEEPYTVSYEPHRTVSAFDAPRSQWRWDGTISRELFDKARLRRGALTLHYKLLNGRLYIADSSMNQLTSPENAAKYNSMLYFKNSFEEMLGVALYLFRMDDVEFIYRFEDGCPRNEPLLTQNLCIDQANAGFGVPEPAVWSRSMGPTQMSIWHACLSERYPADDKIPKAAWRGTSTAHGALLPPGVKVNRENYKKIPRIHLHLLAMNYTDIFDAKLTRLGNNISPDFAAELNSTIAPFLPIEDFNKYCVVMDLDGNAWSGRTSHTFVHGVTPILKATSNFTGALEHFYAPGVSLLNFDPDLHDVVSVVRNMIEDCKLGTRSFGQQMVRNMRTTSLHVMTHVALAESLAYILQVYRKLATWRTSDILEGFSPANITCCHYANVPPKFAADVTNYFVNNF